MFRTFARLVLALVLVAPAVSAAAQSQAINGTIEGTVLDAQGAVLPGVTITVVNTDTGDQRVVVTNDSGLFRAPLRTLGTYRVSAELQGFRKFEQTGVRLSAGSTAVINITAVNDTPTITSDGGGATAGLIVSENSTAVTTVTATDPDAGQTLSYSINGGADASKFAVNVTTGALAFLTPTNFVAPTDGCGIYYYDVSVQVSDGTGGSDSEAIAGSVTW